SARSKKTCERGTSANTNRGISRCDYLRVPTLTNSTSRHYSHKIKLRMVGSWFIAPSQRVGSRRLSKGRHEFQEQRDFASQRPGEHWCLPTRNRRVERWRWLPRISSTTNRWTSPRSTTCNWPSCYVTSGWRRSARFHTGRPKTGFHTLDPMPCPWLRRAQRG